MGTGSFALRRIVGRRLTIAVGAAAAVSGLILVGCRRDVAPPTVPTQVALVPGTTLAGHMAGDAQRGLDRVRHELGVGVTTASVTDEVSRREALRRHGKSGLALVFCLGGGFEAMIYTEAQAFPETRFIAMPVDTIAANVGGISFRIQEASYLAGVVAGLLSPEEVAGIMVGNGGSWIRGVEDGFSSGVRVVRRRGEVVHAAAEPDGPWELAAQGVGAALYAADAADPAVLAAAHDAGVSLVVTDPDALAAEPDVVVAAIHLDLAEAMVRIAQETLDGRLRGRLYAFDLGSGVVDLELSPLFVESAPPVVLETLETARAQITAGIVELEGFGM